MTSVLLEESVPILSIPGGGLSVQRDVLPHRYLIMPYGMGDVLHLSPSSIRIRFKVFQAEKSQRLILLQSLSKFREFEEQGLLLCWIQRLRGWESTHISS